MASPITASCADFKYFTKDPNCPHCFLWDVEVSENPTSWRWHVQGKRHKEKKEELKVEEASSEKPKKTPPKGAGKRRQRSPSVSSRTGSEESPRVNTSQPERDRRP